MSDHTIAGVQALLDADDSRRGQRILKTDNAGVLTRSYYVAGNTSGRGNCRWVNVLVADTDAQAVTKINAKLR